MQVIFCDRCGKETNKNNGNCMYKISCRKDYRFLDLCPKCQKDLGRWLENKEASK